MYPNTSTNDQFVYKLSPNEMIETRLPRKIIGMNRNPTSNSNCNSDAFHEFLHGRKSASTTASTMDQLKWPVSPQPDLQFIWPSKVLLYPSLAIEEVSLNASPSQNTLILSAPKELSRYESVNMDLVGSRRLSGLEISKSLDRLKIDSKEIMSLQSPTTESNPNYNWNTENPIAFEKSSQTHDALKALCLTCADNGEKIAKVHCNRPFFKKIDGLCDRMKQDLIHHDSVVPHINSQGIVWAIKDLIFVSTRIINAWNITKAYVYDPSEGLNKVRSALSSGFTVSFIAWQETTLKLIENLMMSFLSLDIMVHTKNNRTEIKRTELLKKMYVLVDCVTKKTCPKGSDTIALEHCDCDSCKVVLSSQTTHDALMELSFTCSEYGVKIAQNYTNRPFFKKIDSLCDRTKYELTHGDSALANVNSQGIVWTIKEFIFACTRLMNAWNITKGYVYDSSEELDKVRSALSSEFIPSFNAWQDTTKNFIENLRISFLRLDNFAHTESINFKKEDLSKQLKMFKDQLQQLKKAEVFFMTLFCQNYFPDFIAKTPEFKDIRSIIKKCQHEEYKHIFEAVHDVRAIIYQVRNYLSRYTDQKLENAVNNFEAEVDKIFAQKSFKNYRFYHIEGKPQEVLFL